MLYQLYCPHFEADVSVNVVEALAMLLIYISVKIVLDAFTQWIAMMDF